MEENATQPLAEEQAPEKVTVVAGTLIVEAEKTTEQVEEQVEKEVAAEAGVDRSAYNCPDCSGEGLQDIHTLCPTCNGTGKVNG